MHVHATVAGVEMHARARATGKATPAAIYSYSRNALPVLVRDGCRGLEFTLCTRELVRYGECSSSSRVYTRYLLFRSDFDVPRLFLHACARTDHSVSEIIICKSAAGRNS